MATRGQCDANAVVEATAFRVVCGGFILRLVELEADLGEVVELRNGITGNLCLNATFDDRVEKGVDVRLLGEVDE